MLTEERVLSLLTSLLAALDYLHSQGMAHRLCRTRLHTKLRRTGAMRVEEPTRVEVAQNAYDFWHADNVQLHVED